MLRAPIVAAALTLLACSPPAMIPDGGGTGGGCGSALTPPNLLSDPAFECTDGLSWSVQSGAFAVVTDGRSGKAAQLTASPTGQAQAGIGPVVATTSGKSYCVNAWVKGTASDMRLEVLPTMAGSATAFSSPVQADWLQAPMSTNLKVTVAAGDSLYLRVRILNGQAGQTLLLDDLDFYESQSGSCTERH